MTTDPSPSFYLVIDLEATCDEHHRIPPKEMETIEIGAVLVDGQSLAPVDEFCTFVHPVVHPKLTPFCTQLTTIVQDQVDMAPRFAEAINRLRKFIHGRDVLFSSWGDYDRKQLDLDAARSRVTLPFSRHLNLKKRFSEQLGTTERFGMGGALWRVGLPLIGTHHRGIDDARNIARLLPWVLGRTPIPKPSEAPEPRP